MPNTEVEVVSPTATLFEGEANMVVCYTVEGEIAFLAEHFPLIGALDPCPLRIIADDDSETVFAVRGGFVEVRDSKVIVLADTALTKDEIDVEQARSDLQEAQSHSSSGDEYEDQEAERAEKWAQARLEVAGQSAS